MKRTPENIKKGPKWLIEILGRILETFDQRFPVDSDTVHWTDAPGGKGIQAHAAPPGSGAVSSCQFKTRNASEGGTQKVGFAWGTINGQQPIGFAAGGLPEFTITISATRYFFASATFDTDTLLTESVEIISDAASTKTNTVDTVYQLIATANITDGVMTITGSCGPFNLSPCGLAPA